MTIWFWTSVFRNWHEFLVQVFYSIQKSIIRTNGSIIEPKNS